MSFGLMWMTSLRGVHSGLSPLCPVIRPCSLLCMVAFLSVCLSRRLIDCHRQPIGFDPWCVEWCQRRWESLVWCELPVLRLLSLWVLVLPGMVLVCWSQVCLRPGCGPVHIVDFIPVQGVCEGVCVLFVMMGSWMRGIVVLLVGLLLWLVLMCPRFQFRAVHAGGGASVRARLTPFPFLCVPMRLFWIGMTLSRTLLLYVEITVGYG